jgi:hypothetical protein
MEERIPQNCLSQVIVAGAFLKAKNFCYIQEVKFKTLSRVERRFQMTKYLKTSALTYDYEVIDFIRLHVPSYRGRATWCEVETRSITSIASLKGRNLGLPRSLHQTHRQELQAIIRRTG